MNKSNDIFKKITHVLNCQTGLNFDSYKPSTIERRIEKRISVSKYDTIEAYYEFLKDSPDEVERLKTDLLIGVTEFFRDREVFQYLNVNIFSRLTVSHDNLRIWVAGCSTGEEAYSYGILVFNHFERIGLKVNFKIFATDVSASSILIAGKGCYPENALSNVSFRDKEKFFSLKDGFYTVKKILRERIVFAQHNLISDPPFINMHLVSCRNLLIYLHNDSQQKVLANFIFSLQTNGYLQLGSSESLGALKTYFEPVNGKLKLFKCIRKNREYSTNFNKTTPKEPVFISEQPKYSENKSKNSPPMNDFIIRNIFHEFLPSFIVTNTEFDLLYVKGDVSKYLKIEEGIFQANLLKMIDAESSIILKKTIENVLSNKKPIVLKDFIICTKTSKNKVDVKVFIVDDKKEKQQYIAIFFENENMLNSSVQEVKIPKLNEFSKSRILDLENAINNKNDEISILNQELDTLKEKMQASNEELLASNEELQATNEELQSVNEELYSLNTEYQEKNSQLTEVNNDISNLLNSTDIATVFLDKDLNIRNFTPSVQVHFKLQRNDIGRPFNSFSSHFNNHIIEEITSDSIAVLSTTQTIEKEITDISGNTFLRRINPFVTLEGNIEGIVMTFIDITQLVESQKEIEKSQRRYKKLIGNMPNAFAVHRIIRNAAGDPIDYEFLNVNSTFEKLTGLKAKSVIGKTAKQVLQTLDKKWLYIYGKLAEDQKPFTKIEYSPELEKYYEITGYSIEKGFFVTLFTDVTERITKDIKLTQSEEKYRSIVDNALVGVYRTTFDGQLTFANQSFVEILGYKSFKELSKVDVPNFYKNKNDRKKIISTVKNENFITNFECEFIRKDGRAINVLISSQKVGDELSGMIIDITKRITYQNDLLDSQKRFKELIQNSIDGYARVSIDGKIIEANTALCSMLGYSEHELQLKTYQELTPKKWHALEESILAEQVLKKGFSEIYEKEYICSDGRIIPIELRTYLTYDNNGLPIEYWAFIHDISERKKREKQLNENQQRLSLALSSAKQGLYDLNLKTGEAIVNEEYALMLDYDPKAFKETNTFWKERLHPEDRERVKKVFSDYIEGTLKEYKVEFRQKTKKGNYIWILSVGKIVEYDIDGTPLRMLGTHTDINELKSIQEKLAQSKERFKLATQASNVGIWDWDVEKNTVFYSSTWKSQVGYDPQEIENTFSTWEQLLHPEDYKPMHDKLNAYLSNPVQFFEAEFRMRHKHGHYVWIFNRASSVKDKDGNVIRMFGAHTNITAFKEAEEKINTISQRLKIATRSAEIGIWELDLKTNHLYWDEQMYAIYGVKREDFDNNYSMWENALHPNDKKKTLDDFKKTVSGQQNYNTTFHIIRPNQEIRCIHAQAIITRSEDGSSSKMIGVNWDITADEQIKKELVLAKEKAEVANVHKNNFLANMSHEIRTPMNGIIGFAELLKDESTNNEQKDLYLSIINNNSQALLSLIDDIIDISKIEANEISIYKEPVNVNELIFQLETEYNTTKISKNKPDIEFKSVYSKELDNVFIHTDKLRLRQVLINLLNNSLKFSEKGVITFGYELKNHKIEFFVNDQGIGIPSEKAAEIFERFYRLDTKAHRKYSGTGLGLAISKGLINLLGGNIWVDATYTEGAAIHFTIPYKTIDVIPVKEQSISFKEQSKPLNGLTAMLVEDQESVYTFFKEVLNKTGIKLLWFDNGEEAIEKYKEDSQNINFVLMDINLPGINGIEATKQILSYDPSAIIIAQTAYAMKEELDNCLKAGCIDCITKPINPKELLKKIKKYS